MKRIDPGRTNERFQGFPRGAFRFLAGLARNNNKAWFEEHRGEYDSDVLRPALRFAASMGSALRAIEPGILLEPRIGGSLFRIHRDTRFSKDRSPYKTHVGIRFRDAEAAGRPGCSGPVFYVEFDAQHLRLGAGVKEFDRGALDAYRNEVLHGSDRAALLASLDRARQEGHAILGDALKRAPVQGRSEMETELLKRKGVFVQEEIPIPEEMYTPEFVPYCKRWFGRYVPLFRFLRGIVPAGRGGS